MLSSNKDDIEIYKDVLMKYVCPKCKSVPVYTVFPGLTPFVKVVCNCVFINVKMDLFKLKKMMPNELEMIINENDSCMNELSNVNDDNEIDVNNIIRTLNEQWRLLQEKHLKYKNDIIVKLKHSIERIEQSYQSNLNANEYIVNLIKSLLSVYNEMSLSHKKNNNQINIKQSIINNTLFTNTGNNISYAIPQHRDIDNVIHFYSSNFIIKQPHKETDYLYTNNNSIIQLKHHSNTILSLIKLSNNNFASSSSDHSINIYNYNTTLNNYSLLIHKQNAHNSSVYALTEINLQQDHNNSIFFISAGWDNYIKLWSFSLNTITHITSIKTHTKGIFNIITTPNNTIISCSADKSICIYSLKQTEHSYTFINIKQLTAHNGNVYSVLYLHSFPSTFISCSDDSQLIHWNMETFSIINTIQNICVCWRSSVFENKFGDVLVGCVLNKGKNGIGKEYYVYIVSLKCYQIEMVISNKCAFECRWIETFCFYEEKNGDVLIGCPSGSVCKLSSYKNGAYCECEVIKNKLHKDGISGIIKLNDECFCTSGFDFCIFIWRYNH